MFRKFTYFKILFFLLMLSLASCLTYYQINAEFSKNFERGNLAEAKKYLDKDKKGAKGRNRLLFHFNQGTVNALMGNLAESNRYFNDADRTIEDYRRNGLAEAASFLSNPNITEYKPENHEQLLIHYYKALNYLKLGDNEAALVECRRMNLKLQELSDKHKSEDKYSKDAFGHLLMGIIHDAAGDYNNAFIAYRNALNIYESDYAKLFGLSAPEQLKKDVLRAAARTGLFDELDFYEKKFGFKYIKDTTPNAGELVFFWNNGLGPVKDEWSINFNIIRGSGGNVMFVNNELGLSFPFFLNTGGSGSGSLSDLEFIRVAFPKYVERRTAYSGAELQSGSLRMPLHRAQAVNDIAFKVLKERMMEELGKSLLRLALKKASEYQLRKQNEGAGMLLSVVNAVTEKADTRNWQTLPHDIFYSRMILPAGTHDVALHTQAGSGRYGAAKVDFKFDIKKGRTEFASFHSLEHEPLRR